MKKKIGFWKWLLKLIISLFKGIPQGLHDVLLSVEVELFFGIFFGLFGTIGISSHFGNLVGALNAIGCLLLILHGFFRMSGDD